MPTAPKVFRTAEQVITVVEGAKKYGTPSQIGALDSRDVADFRHAVRNAAEGTVVYVPVESDATAPGAWLHYEVVGRLMDGTRLYAARFGGAPEAGA